MADLVFFGHLTGHGSYSVVSRALADFIERNLKRLPKYERFFAHDLRSGSRFRKPVEIEKSTALLFGHPTHWCEVPAFKRCIGYHVFEEGVPDQWVGIMNSLDGLITPSLSSLKIMQAAGVKPTVFLVNHGVNDQIYKPMGLPNKDGKILHYCSSPSLYRKGTDEVLKVLHRRPDLAAKVMLVLGPEVVDTGSIPCEWVRRQPLPEREFADEIRAARAVYAPSLHEGFGLIPLQAACCGTAVLLSDKSGHKEFSAEIPDSKTCDIEQDLEMLAHDSMWERLVGNQRKRTHVLRAQWSWDAVLTRDFLLNII